MGRGRAETMSRRMNRLDRHRELPVNFGDVFQHGIRQRQFVGGDIGLQLLHRGRADDRGGDEGPRKNEGERHLRRVEAVLPGKPDIVLPRFKTVVFVNGCFWLFRAFHAVAGTSASVWHVSMTICSGWLFSLMIIYMAQKTQMTISGTA